MSWAKLDDRANEHLKQLSAGPAACWLWACGLMYCNRQRNNSGRIPKQIVLGGMLFPKLGKREAAKLVEAGLWYDDGDCFVVHDYAEYNPSPVGLSEKRAEAGRLGGKRSGASRKANAKQLASSKTEALASEANEAPGSTPLHSTPEDPPKPPAGGSMSLKDRAGFAASENPGDRQTIGLKFGEPRRWPEVRAVFTEFENLSGSSQDARTNGDSRVVVILKWFAAGYSPDEVIETLRLAWKTEFWKGKPLVHILKQTSRLDELRQGEPGKPVHKPRTAAEALKAVGL